MAQVIKKIAIKENNGWTQKPIGVDTENVHLTSPLMGQNNLQAAFTKYFPSEPLDSGLLISNNGKISSSGVSSNTITELGTRVSTLENSNTNKNTEWVNNIITAYMNSNLQSLLNGENVTTLISNIVKNELLSAGYAPIDTSTLTNFTALLSNTLYPIDSIFISKSPENPKSKLGGEWVPIKDKFLIDAEQITIEGQINVTPEIKVTRSKNVIIDNHEYKPSGSVKNNLTPCKNTLQNQGTMLTANFQNRLVALPNAETDNVETTFDGETVSLTHIITQQPEFSASITAPINIIPPYEKVYIWKRTDLANPEEFYTITPENWDKDFLLSPETVALWKKVDSTSTEGEI